MHVASAVALAVRAAADGGVLASLLYGQDPGRRAFNMEARNFPDPAGERWVFRFTADACDAARGPCLGEAGWADRTAAGGGAAGALGGPGAAAPAAAGAGGAGAEGPTARSAAAAPAAACAPAAPDAAGGAAAGGAPFHLPTLSGLASMQTVLKEWTDGDPACGRIPISTAWKEGRMSKKLKQRVSHLRILVQITHERAGQVQCERVTTAADVARSLDKERLATRDPRGLPVPFATFAKALMLERHQ